MPDLIYLLLTLGSFAGLALLVGRIDRRLGSPDPEPDPEPDLEPDPATAPEASSTADHEGVAR